MSLTQPPALRTQNIAHLLRWLADEVDNGGLTEPQVSTVLSALTEHLDPAAPRRALEEGAAGMQRLARGLPRA